MNMTIKSTIAAFLAAIIALASFERGYDCSTDTECEIEEERKCLFLCN